MKWPTEWNKKAPSPTAARKMSSGCAMVFPIPFAVVSVIFSGWLVKDIFDYHAMQGWVEVPATIVRIPTDGRGHCDGSCDLAQAEYQYTFGGQTYQNDAVSLTGKTSDNIGSFQKTTQKTILDHQRSGRPMPCYVNPSNPSESILYRDIRWSMVGFKLAFIVVFGLFGFGLPIGMRWAARTAKRAAELPADQRWTYRADWATGRIRSSLTSSVGLLAFAIVWNGIVAAIFVPNGRDIWNSGGFGKYFVVGFPAVGLAVAIGAIVLLGRQLKYGRSILELTETPARIGGELRGTVRVRRRIDAADGFVIKLKCLQRIQSGEDSHDRTIWEGQAHAVGTSSSIVGNETTIPVRIAIPGGIPESSPPGTDNAVRWELSLSADTPGLDYKAAFDVPVFQ